jgi:HPt (histidine-containing phosphotransfer) domain-containing protein
VIDSLRERFRQRLADVAKERIERARELLGKGHATAAARELHALAGEAALLSYEPLAAAARRAQCTAAAEGASAADRDAALDELVAHIERELSPPPPGS